MTGPELLRRIEERGYVCANVEEAQVLEKYARDLEAEVRRLKARLDLVTWGMSNMNERPKGDTE